MTLFMLMHCSIMHLGAFKKSQNHFITYCVYGFIQYNLSKKNLKGPVISLITYIILCSQSNVKLDSLTTDFNNVSILFFLFVNIFQYIKKGSFIDKNVFL